MTTIKKTVIVDLDMIVKTVRFSSPSEAAEYIQNELNSLKREEPELSSSNERIIAHLGGVRPKTIFWERS